MKKHLSLIFASIAWFAVIAQYYLMIENRVTPIIETSIRFFSFFTILTNSLVAIYFTLSILKKKIIDKPGTLTAVTVYITIVGIVYQIILRPIWKPTGLQMIVNELLHSVIPLLVILFWYLYEEKKSLTYKQLPMWLIYPFVYLLYILVRGSISNFYPYPFVDVANLGFAKVLSNSAILMLVFISIAALFITLGKIFKK